jgi:LysM repeat protein
LVAVPGRTWRAYAGPAAFLLAATIAVVIVRGELRHHSVGGTGATTHTAPKVSHAPAKPAVYVVRAGDTLDAIAAKVGVPVKRLLRLNPKLSPTALFIGEKVHLR